ncbi:MAG TPA: efflux RND transporter permease subunit, partial [Gemmatirosa sp.]
MSAPTIARGPDGTPDGRPAPRGNLIRAAIANRQVVYLLTTLVVILGLTSLVRMPRREDPKITIRQGLVLALYPGATAEQVERQVAEPVERRLFSHGEVKKAKTFTTSRPGALVANVELNDDVRDPDRFWSMLRHDLNETKATELPAGVVGPIVNADFGDVVAVLLTVHGPPGRYGSRELATFLDRIEDAVRTLPDVSKIKRYGEQPEEIAVTARPERLAQYGVTTQQLSGALRARNAVVDGGAVDAGASDVRIRPAGPFNTVQEVGALQIATAPGVGTSRGVPVTLRDVATIERRYADPTFVARVDNQPVVLMSIEAQEGRNLVTVGRAIDAKLTAVRATLPPDVRVDLIADQPASVQHRVLGFGREFTIAVVAVILVTVLLLPLRVAAIAATAIPITVAVTIAALNALGIELHQMSFAGLVVALGMVVDDAIVIADNYVELLDHGVPRDEAAWRSASDLAIPVLGATLTIVASFLPLAFLLPGTVGEFIRALPLTVSVALVCSYVVAMLLTPLLCLAFIKTGLRPHVGHGAAAAPRRFDPLGAMQRLYERTMRLAMPRKALTLALSGAAFVAGVVMLRFTPMRFFPAAERAQFVVDVWTPEGTRFEATDSVVQRLVADVRRVRGVRAVGSFTGGGSPRFYYNINPEPPATNYGQLVVNTDETDATPALAASLHARLAALAPEATVVVKELQQGAALPAPIEIRYSGADLTVLRRLADSARAVLEATLGSEYVTTNWRDDRYGVRVDLRRETAARLGITDADVAQQLAGGFDGATASTYYEGDRRIDVRLRLDSASRQGVGDVRDAYVTSPVTAGRLPLREVADVRPEWQPSRIVRRNGVRTVTVQSFARSGVLASTVLNAALPRLQAVPVPPGYAMTLGGEIENQAEVQGPMSVALSVSLLGIFVILFLQFRNARYPLIVMVSIPLAVFGSALGLVLTRNPFGFTAQLGLTALTGVVVRKAIILVDYIIARRDEGESLEDAALDAGRRRLRPIFLTTTAAAVGVVPLIVSGSSLWSPLASVLAVGLVCSM